MPAAIAGKGLSILVAEDNEINALLTRALLTELGHRPTWSPAAPTRSRHGRRRGSAATPYDLVLMDVHMPGHGRARGDPPHPRREAARRNGRTPIVALTANAYAEDREACLAAGMDGFLVKPLDRERLREVLAAVPTGGARRLTAAPGAAFATLS